MAAGHGSGHGSTGGVDDARPLNDRPGDGHSLTGGDHGSHDIQNSHGDSPVDMPDASSGDGPDGGALHDGADHGDGTLDSGSAEHRASIDHMPRPEPRNQNLEVLPDSRVERGADGLIESIDGRPVDDYLRDVAEQRAEQYRTARAEGAFSGGDMGPVNSVAIDRHTGEVFEATNGRRGDEILPDRVHPLSRSGSASCGRRGPALP